MAESSLPVRKRLRKFERSYSLPGSYYVTVCIHGNRCLLGDGDGSQVALNEAGRMVADVWRALPDRFEGLRLDEYVVMPNHLHGILRITHPHSAERAMRERASISRVINAFKGETTLRYGRGVRDRNWPRYERRLWHRSFYDHIVRDEEDLAHARGYIRRNPGKWARDPYNPRRTGRLYGGPA